uniref:Uncharacterized protein n=1 Tax=Micromonas pusilla TaxID=38833 RepID=A0A7S0I7J3_MICPS|mmetsp:Transcript_10855/g.45196  ORF Transcript_10855/g.45196 Transcript_10855/m.45196 type:complete len:288 (+) Transcript_10855:121-984(+)
MAVPDPDEADEAVVELGSGSDDGVAGGTEGDDDDEHENVAGTDDDVPPPDGENYFGRAAKEGAAPAGANPFAVPAPAADDDWAREIAEAKRMVEEQRVKREREEAIERQKEIEAAEAKGKVYEERRKAGDSPLPSAGGGGAGGPGGAARRERKIVRAKRPTGGGGGSTPTPGGVGVGGGGGGGGGRGRGRVPRGADGARERLVGAVVTRAVGGAQEGRPARGDQRRRRFRPRQALFATGDQGERRRGGSVGREGWQRRAREMRSIGTGRDVDEGGTPSDSFRGVLKF